MDNNSLKWRIALDHDVRFGPGPSIILAREADIDGSMDYVVDVTFKRVDMWVRADVKPLITGPAATSFLQEAMDAAYEAGLRPSRAQDERHLKAHLDDMRAIAFKQLKMERK